MLSLRDLLTGEPNRLRFVRRFGTCHTVHAESVAEHTTFVGLYCMFVGDWCERWGNTSVDMEQLLRAALLHDLEEGRSGDFPRPFKYSDPELKSALDRAAEIAFKQVVDPVWKEQPPGNPGSQEVVEELRNLYLVEWLDAKDDTPEGAILEFCDFLSALGYLHLEIGGSNLTMRQHLEEMWEYWQRFTKERFHFLGPLVEQARALMTDAFGLPKKRADRAALTLQELKGAADAGE